MSSCNINSTSQLRPCCEKLLNDNQMLKRALQKERERRQMVEAEYKKLLVELRSILDASVQSLSTSDHHHKLKSSSVSSQNNLNGETGTSENACLTPSRLVSSKQQMVPSNQKALILTSSSNVMTNNGRAPLANPIDSINNTRNSKRRRKMADFAAKSSVRAPFRDTTNDSSIIIIEQDDNQINASNKDTKTINFQQTLKSVNYFFSLDENDRPSNTEKKKQFYERSKQRCRAIKEASRKRALIVANRRAVIADILMEKRQLDEDALKIINADSSSICAFPSLLKKMKAASRRKFEKSSLRHKLENERRKKLGYSINRILAHVSAMR